MPTDRERLGYAGGSPTRTATIRGVGRRRGSSRENPTQIEILQIDDRKARKELKSFFDIAKKDTKTAADEIRKMWDLSTGYSKKYVEETKRGLGDLEVKRRQEHAQELIRIRERYRASEQASVKEAKLAEAVKRHNIELIGIEKQKNEVKRQGARIDKEIRSLQSKYEGTSLGRKIEPMLRSYKEKMSQLDEQYKRASETLNPKDIESIAEETDKIEEELDSINRSVKDTIDSSERRSEGIKKALKQFLSQAVTILTHNYIEGIHSFANSYENTFTDFAGRLGYNYEQTRQFYSDIITNTYSNGMDTAISISKELIPSIQVALQKGFTGSDSIAKAIADEQSRILMPWLDTQSDAWVNMSFNMSKQNMDLLKSQQLQLQSINRGNRLLQTGVISSLTDEIEPLLRDVEYNTGTKGFSGQAEQAALLALTNEGKMDPREAYNIVSKALQIQKSGGYEYLSSGDTVERLMAEAYVNGGNTLDMLRAILPVIGIASGGSNLNSGAVLSILGGSLPLSSKTAGSAKRLEDAILAAPSYLNQLETDESRFAEELKDINGRLSATKSQENKQQNDTARVGEWVSAIPQGTAWFTSIIELGEAILAAVIAGFGGDILSKAMRSAGANSFLSKLFNGGDLSSSASKAVEDVVNNGASNTAKTGLLSKEITGTPTALKVGTGIAIGTYLTLKPNTNTENDESEQWWIDQQDQAFQNYIAGMNESDRAKAISDRKAAQIAEANNEAKTRYNSQKNSNLIDRLLTIIYPELDNGVIGRGLGEGAYGKYWTSENIKYAQDTYDKWLAGDQAEYESMLRRIEASMPDAEWLFFKALLDNLTSDTGRSISDLPVEWWDPEVRKNYDDWKHNRETTYGSLYTNRSLYKNGLIDYFGDSYAIGSPYITEDQLAELHEGERVLTRRQNQVFGDIGSTGLLLAGATVINKLLGISSVPDDDDISREDMTETLVNSLDKVTAAISSLSNGIDYGNRTLPRVTNSYSRDLVNLSPVVSATK